MFVFFSPFSYITLTHPHIYPHSLSHSVSHSQILSSLSILHTHTYTHTYTYTLFDVLKILRRVCVCMFSLPSGCIDGTEESQGRLQIGRRGGTRTPCWGVCVCALVEEEVHVVALVVVAYLCHVCVYVCVCVLANIYIYIYIPFSRRAFNKGESKLFDIDPRLPPERVRKGVRFSPPPTPAPAPVCVCVCVCVYFLGVGVSWRPNLSKSAVSFWAISSMDAHSSRSVCWWRPWCILSEGMFSVLCVFVCVCV